MLRKSPFLAAAMAAGILVTTGLSAGAQAAPEKQDLAARIIKLDTNSDGVVERSEYDVYVVRSFKRMDTDGDGTLTMADLQAIAEKRDWKEKRVQRMAERLGVTASTGVSQDQFVANSKIFALIDVDGDGKLTVTEIETFATKAAQRKTAPTEG